jgi:hypothetical protein
MDLQRVGKFDDVGIASARFSLETLQDDIL